MELGEHAGFIIAGYLISFLIIGGAIVLSLNAGRRVRARIAELEARGIRRRSQRPVEAAGGAAKPEPKA